MGSGSDMQVVGILLAAGSGRRFAASGGGNKLMAPLPGTEPVAVASARAMLAVLPRVIAVVPDHDGQLGRALQRAGCEVTVCGNAGEGMGASLVHALSYSLGQSGPPRSAPIPARFGHFEHSSGHVPAQDAGQCSSKFGHLAQDPRQVPTEFIPLAGRWQEVPQGWVIALADMPFVLHASIASLRDALVAGAGIAVPTYQGRRGNPVGFGSVHLDQLLALHGDQGARAIVKAHAVTEVVVEDPGILRDIDTVDDLASE